MMSGVINGHGRLDLDLVMFGLMDRDSPNSNSNLLFIQNLTEFIYLAMDIHGHQDLSLGSLVYTSMAVVLQMV